MKDFEAGYVFHALFLYHWRKMDNKVWDFDSWAKSYDVSVRDGNWIHESYDQTLELVTSKVVERVKWRNQSMLDIGAGTGNLESLLTGCQGLSITAIEPSASMREKFSQKHPTLKVLPGNIPDGLPEFEEKFDIITSTYVVHHVPFDQLEKMIKSLCDILNNDGLVIIIDPMFESAQFRDEHIEQLKRNGCNELAEEIEDEFFTLLLRLEPVLRNSALKSKPAG